VDFSIANTDHEKAIWMVYDVDENGLLKNGKLFFDATDKTKTLKGLPDGMKVHRIGWVFATGPGGALIFTLESEHPSTIFISEATANYLSHQMKNSMRLSHNFRFLRRVNNQIASIYFEPGS
jgi:gluconolactonase